MPYQKVLRLVTPKVVLKVSLKGSLISVSARNIGVKTYNELAKPFAVSRAAQLGNWIEELSAAPCQPISPKGCRDVSKSVLVPIIFLIQRRDGKAKTGACQHA